jgi:hypothetical protein
MSVILIPRLYIPVQGSYQEIDPIDNFRTLKRLWNYLLNEPKNINTLYAIMSYWLPSLLLLTSDRFKSIWYELRNFKGFILIYLSLNLLLTVYGGTNLLVFVSYSVAVQIVILSLLIKHGIHPIELVFMLMVMLIYNKILLNIPLPQENFDAYIDFYGGWSSRVNIMTVVRFLEMLIFILMSKGLRVIIQIYHSDSHQHNG